MMRLTRVTLLIIFLIASFALCGAAQTLPHVHLITTGGTSDTATIQGCVDRLGGRQP